VFDSDVRLQWVAMRARFPACADEAAETDGFGDLAEEGVDDGQVAHNDGDECFAAGPEAAADCAFWSGL
jgi:hypothetical protein